MDLFKEFSILSWNIRGALGKSARQHVREIIKSHRPSLYLIYETHGAFSKVERLWHNLGYKPHFIQEARGHSVGIWDLSCKDEFFLRWWIVVFKP